MGDSDRHRVRLQESTTLQAVPRNNDDAESGRTTASSALLHAMAAAAAAMVSPVFLPETRLRRSVYLSFERVCCISM